MSTSAPRRSSLPLEGPVQTERMINRRLERADHIIFFVLEVGGRRRASSSGEDGGACFRGPFLLNCGSVVDGERLIRQADVEGWHADKQIQAGVHPIPISKNRKDPGSTLVTGNVSWTLETAQRFMPPRKSPDEKTTPTVRNGWP